MSTQKSTASTKKTTPNTNIVIFKNTNAIPEKATVNRPAPFFGANEQQAETENKSSVYNLAVSDAGLRLPCVGIDVPIEYRSRFDVPLYPPKLDESINPDSKKHDFQVCSPLDVESQQSFHYCPRAYSIDDIIDDNKIASINYERNWETALKIGEDNEDNEEKEEEYKECFSKRFFYSPFPNARYNQVANVDPIHFIDLTFTFPFEAMRHSEFVDKFGGAGNNINIRITREQLERVLLPIVDFKKVDYHIYPFSIALKNVYSTIPIALSGKFRSSMSPISKRHTPCYAGSSASYITNAIRASLENPKDISRNFTTNFVEWNNHHGVCSSHSVSGNLDGGFIIQKNQKGFVNSSSPLNGLPIYIGDSTIYNNPDFTRWMAVDFKELRDELNDNKRVPLEKFEGIEAYLIKCPSASECKGFSLLFWIFVEYFPIIHSRSKLLFPDIMYTQAVNRVIIHPAHGRVVRVLKEVYDSIWERFEDLFDKDVHLMNLNELVLSLSPLNGNQGWEDYKTLAANQEMATDIRKYKDESENAYANFTATFTIAYEPYYIGPDGRDEMFNQSKASPLHYNHCVQRLNVGRFKVQKHDSNGFVPTTSNNSTLTAPIHPSMHMMARPWGYPSLDGNNNTMSSVPPPPPVAMYPPPPLAMMPAPPGYPVYGYGYGAPAGVVPPPHPATPPQ